MRAAPTRSEEAAWRVRAEFPSLEVRRQVPIGKYIGDFLVPSLRLVIVVDGGYHAKRAAADERRDRALARTGYRVVRVCV